jgi:hypothetical protein
MSQAISTPPQLEIWKMLGGVTTRSSLMAHVRANGGGVPPTGREHAAHFTVHSGRSGMGGVAAGVIRYSTYED